jgi:hypothetical protein
VKGLDLETNLTLIKFIEDIQLYSYPKALFFEYKTIKKEEPKKINLRSCSEKFEDHWKLMSIYNMTYISSIIDSIKNEDMIVRRVEIILPRGTIKLETIPHGIEYEFFHKFMINHVLPTSSITDLELVEFDQRSIRRYNSFNIKSLTENKFQYENNTNPRPSDSYYFPEGLLRKLEANSLPF